MWALKYIVVCKQKSSVTKRVAERHCRIHICIRINITSVVDPEYQRILRAFLQSLLSKARLKFVGTTSLRYDV